MPPEFEHLRPANFDPRHFDYNFYKGYYAANPQRTIVPLWKILEAILIIGSNVNIFLIMDWLINPSKVHEYFVNPSNFDI